MTRPQTIRERGHSLLENPLLNKGSAFSLRERRQFQLDGLLPPHVSTWEEQLARTYGNFRQKETDLERHIFLTSLQDRNETLFYGLLERHIEEMMPIIYTPTVGLACQSYSRIYRRPRGLFLSYPDKNRLRRILANVPHNDVRIIVVTDGERILGLGDLGLNGIGIPIGKLALYTVCAGFHPSQTLPIVLDVGTDTESVRRDPLYLGWRHARVRGAAYDAFIKSFVDAVKARFPRAILQWEDFAKNNAARLLDRYRERALSFNDDIQGTGAVTLAGLLAATRAAGRSLREERVVILGAGSAATGIGDQIVLANTQDGRSPAEARRNIWLVDSQGLVHTGRQDLEPTKRRFAQPWSGPASLADVVARVKPGALIGTSAQRGAFSRALVVQMARHVDRPIIFPLSNPTHKSEAIPEDLYKWTDGKAIVATGSPFLPVRVGRRTVTVGQCNNVYIFPGMGLGAYVSGARRISEEMFVAAARALARRSPALQDPNASMFPPLTEIRRVTKAVALAVAEEAGRTGRARLGGAGLKKRIDAACWSPAYGKYKP